jgi:hypothetical protein
MPDFICPLCQNTLQHYKINKNLDHYADSNFGVNISYEMVSCSSCLYNVELNENWTGKYLIIAKDELKLLKDNGWTLVGLYPLKIRKEMLNVVGDYEVLSEVTKIKQILYSKKT